MKKRFTLIVLAFLLIMVATTCKKDVHVTGVKLNETTLTLEVDDTATLVATVFPENATIQSVIFTSSNPNVATVISNGLVTAVSKGVAVIEVTTIDGNSSARCTVHVDEGFVIEAQVLSYAFGVASVAASILGEDDEYKVLVSTKYENNSFKLKLPGTVNNKYLRSFADYWLSISLFKDIEESWVSDKNAKLTLGWISGLDVDNVVFGSFIYSGSYVNNSHVQCLFLYADRNFTVKGEKIDEAGIPFQCDCSFNKGWNFMYWNHEENYYAEKYSSLTTYKLLEGFLYWNFYQWPEEWKKTDNNTRIRNLFEMQRMEGNN